MFTFLLTVLVSLISALLYIASLVWLYNDVNKRNLNGCLLVILVAIFAWPIGLILWLVVRSPLPGRTGRRFRSGSSQICTQCGGRVSRRVARCPSCGQPRAL